jgi:sarcosine oxidase subunit gamma
MTLKACVAMVETGTRRSPLADWSATFAAMPSSICLRELPFLTQLNLRIDPTGPAVTAVSEVLGAALPMASCTSHRVPLQTNTTDGTGELELLWLGPDEWLILGPPGVGPDVQDSLRQAIGGGFGAVTDVSAQRTALRMSGPAARDVLSRGCSIDLHPQVSPRGACVQTLLAQTGAIVVVRDDTATDFLLLVRSSFAEYAAAWLVDAATEAPSGPGIAGQ